MAEPLAYYVVAATPRTGSSLLCEGLAATGIAGRPAEVFAPDFRGPWFKRWSLSRSAPFRDYLACAIAYGTTDNGEYGMKIQWMHVPVLALYMKVGRPFSDVLKRLFPGARYLNMVRQDRRSQALSWYRAMASGEWFRFRGTPAPAPPLAPRLAQILRIEAEIARQQGGWEQFFSSEKIAPHVIEYERLAGDYRGELARALAFLGHDPTAAQSVARPLLERQADIITEGWREAFDQAAATRREATLAL